MTPSEFEERATQQDFVDLIAEFMLRDEKSELVEDLKNERARRIVRMRREAADSE